MPTDTSKQLIIWLALVFLPLLACGPIPESEGLLTQWLNATPTAVSSVSQPANSPPRDYLTYQTFTYRVALNPGERVPGTNLTYIGPRDRLYEVEINGQRAVKSGGDSFNWEGVINAGVAGDFDLRLSPQLLGDMLAVGTVELAVLNPVPREATLPTDSTNWYAFPEMIVDVSVPISQTIPGTTLIYEGLEPQGAKLGNTAGYPYLAQADSLRWTGRLSTNAYVRYNLRVVSMSDQALRMAGVAEVWVRK
jgi:hypothetical protein